MVIVPKSVFILQNTVKFLFPEITKYFLKEKEKDYLGENPVLVLTDDNFDDIASTAETMLVNFYVTQ